MPGPGRAVAWTTQRVPAKSLDGPPVRTGPMPINEALDPQALSPQAKRSLYCSPPSHPVTPARRRFAPRSARLGVPDRSPHRGSPDTLQKSDLGPGIAYWSEAGKRFSAGTFTVLTRRMPDATATPTRFSLAVPARGFARFVSMAGWNAHDRTAAPAHGGPCGRGPALRPSGRLDLEALTDARLAREAAAMLDHDTALSARATLWRWHRRPWPSLRRRFRTKPVGSPDTSRSTRRSTIGRP